MTATPNGADARAVFSGDCVIDAEYGVPASCELTLDANKVLTVTFSCRADTTCAP